MKYALQAIWSSPNHVQTNRTFEFMFRKESGRQFSWIAVPITELNLRLDNVSKDPSAGIVFGSDGAVCDVVLPSLKGISGRYFAITFVKAPIDGLYRLAIRDLGSTTGTSVTPLNDDQSGLGVNGGANGRSLKSFTCELDDTMTKGVVIRPHPLVAFRPLPVELGSRLSSIGFVRKIVRFLGIGSAMPTQTQQAGPQQVAPQQAGGTSVPPLRLVSEQQQQQQQAMGEALPLPPAVMSEDQPMEDY